MCKVLILSYLPVTIALVFDRNRQCHIYPFNKGEPTTGHAAVRTHTEVKRQAFEVCTNKEAGKKVLLLLLCIQINICIFTNFMTACSKLKIK